MITLNIAETEAALDWLKAGRLRLLADAGDKAASKELRCMENTRMFPVKIEMKHP